MGSTHRLPLLLLLAALACRSLPLVPPTAASPGPTSTPRASPTARPSRAAPTATSTLRPAPEYFNEEFETGAPYWRFSSSPSGATALDVVADGALRLTMSSGNLWAYAVYEPHTYADVRIEAAVDLGAEADASAGLLCRHSLDSGWYEFNIYADGTYTLLFGEWLVEGLARYTPLAIDETEAIISGLNEIGLVCSGDTLTAFINGKQVRSRQERLFVLTEGAVGLSAASFEAAPLVVAYERVSVSRP